MPRQQKKPTHFYSVHVTFYANAEVKARIERGEPLLTDFAAMTSELVYSGTNERQAMITFYQAAKRAMSNPLVDEVRVWRDTTVLIRVKPERI